MIPALVYLLGFLALSAAIGLLAWPGCQRRWGLVTGALAWLLAGWLGWRLAELQGMWSALLAAAPPVPGDLWAPLQGVVEGLLEMRRRLAEAIPSAAALVNLSMILVFLALYLVVKAVLLPPAYLFYLLGRLRRARRGPARAGGLPLNAIFLRATADRLSPALAAVLALLPYLMTWHSAIADYFALLFWAGMWIMLLELRLWLRAQETDRPAMAVSGDDVAARAHYPLDRVYREYLQRHPSLLFYGANQPPQLNSAQEYAGQGRAAGELAGQLRQQLADYLPAGLLERLLPPVRHYEQGGDVLFTEALCSYHFLLLAAFIQHRKNRGEVTLLICPAAAVADVETALQAQLDLHQLRLSHRWTVLGRDPVTATSQLDLLICPDSGLEQGLLGQPALLAETLSRLRLLVCLDAQGLELSRVRLALHRLWLAAPSRRRQQVVQAEPCHHMESQLRYLFNFRQASEHQLNPELGARRYLLVWDAHAPDREALTQHYFHGLPAALEISQVLCLPPWQFGFEVTHLDPEGRYNEDAYEHLRNELLPRYGHEALLERALPSRSSGHLYAADQQLVCLMEDRHNLPLALNRNSNFSGARASLLNIVCGDYLLRDYFRACLYAAGGPHQLSPTLRPLAARPRGALPELAAALGAALQGSGGLTRAQVESLLALAPAGLLAPLGVEADGVGLRRLFQQTLANPPQLRLLGQAGGEIRYALSPEADLGGAGHYRIVNEQGAVIGALPAADHGLRYAVNQRLLLQRKFHHIVAVEPALGQVRVRHQEDRCGAERRQYGFRRRYRLAADPGVREGQPISIALPGGLTLTIKHRHAAFEGISEGYLEFEEAARPLAAGSAGWRYVALEPPLRREHRLQNVGGVRLRQAGLTGDHEAAKVAFTLAALLQDCLPSLFPQHDGRLAVVSPQCGRDEAQDEIHGFYLSLYPALAEPVTADESASAGDELVFYILEDWPGDLGVVRALCDPEDWELLLGLARDYLAWAAPQSEATLYQAYGADSLPACLDYPGALAVLDKLLPGRRSPATAPLAFRCDPDAEAASPAVQAGDTLCDFCAAPITGPHAELADGRRRCGRCGEDAVNTVAAFEEMLRDVINRMERRYRIRLPEGIQVRFVDAKEIARHAGQTFTPTAGLDPRAVGLAIQEGDGRLTMLLENGAPRLSTEATLVHELTHLWQYGLGLDLKAVPVEVIEGQARYAEIDALWAFGGELLAAQRQREAEHGDDVYARGYRQVAERCAVEAEQLFGCFARMLMGE